MPTPTNLSPNVDNYFSGKGKVKFKPVGSSTWRDLGDCPAFELTPNVTRMEHYSNREGVRERDFSKVAQRQLGCRITMDELTADNFAMALMGIATISGSPSTDHYDYSVSIMSEVDVLGAIRLVGTNLIGAPVQVDLPAVSFAPGTAVQLIQEQLATIETTGEVQASGGSFGTIYWNITQEINP